MYRLSPLPLRLYTLAFPPDRPYRLALGVARFCRPFDDSLYLAYAKGLYSTKIRILRHYRFEGLPIRY